MNNSKLKKKYVSAHYKDDINLAREMLKRNDWLRWYTPKWYNLKVVDDFLNPSVFWGAPIVIQHPRAFVKVSVC